MTELSIPRSSRIESHRDNSRSKQTLRLWLRLFSCEAMVEHKVRALLRDTYDMTLPQFDVLAELEHADKPLTMSQLSSYLVVSNGNITGVVDRLERDEYVHRVPSKEDRRVQYIELSKKGKREFAKIAEQHEQWIAELFKELSDGEVDQFINLLKKTKESIKQQE